LRQKRSDGIEGGASAYSSHVSGRSQLPPFEEAMDILGIDVGKEYIDCELLGEKRATKRVHNTVRGFEQLQTWLRHRKAHKVHACMEATGGWSEELAFYLQERGHVVSIVNPMQIRAFGQSELSRTKTDKADAALIARFCKAMQPNAWEAPKDAYGNWFGGVVHLSKCARKNSIV
jgi:transposase